MTKSSAAAALRKPPRIRSIKPPASRQARWRQKMRAAGRCIECGRARGARRAEKLLCLPCAIKATEYQRRYRGQQAWRPGGPGHPPVLHLAKRKSR